MPGTFSGMEDTARAKWKPGCLGWGLYSGDGVQEITCILCQIVKFLKRKQAENGESGEWRQRFGQTDVPSFLFA